MDVITVHAVGGETLMLPCDSWLLHNASITEERYWSYSANSTNFEKIGFDRPKEDRPYAKYDTKMEFAVFPNFSLQLFDIKESSSGYYRCGIILVNGDEPIRETFVNVSGKQVSFHQFT